MAGIYKRGKTYWARAQRNGREFRESLKTGDRRVALRRFEEWKERLEALSWGERPRVSFREAVKQFMLQHFPGLKPKSAKRYAQSLKWLADKWDGQFLDQIDRGSLSEFETDRRTAGAASPTIRRDLACLSSLLSFCEDREWIEEGKNLVPGFLRRRAKRGLKEGNARTRWLTHAEEAKLLTAASSPLREAIALAIDTGLREQELFSTTWGQVDLENQTITTTKDTKNGRKRIVPLPARSAHILAQWKATQTGKVASLYILRRKNGKRFKNLYRGFKALAARLKIEDVNWHDLRRTAGCRWLQDYKKSLGEVSILLGHSSITITERHYAFFDGKRLAEETAAHFPAHKQADKIVSNGKD